MNKAVITRWLLFVSKHSSVWFPQWRETFENKADSLPHVYWFWMLKCATCLNILRWTSNKIDNILKNVFYLTLWVSLKAASAINLWHTHRSPLIEHLMYTGNNTCENHIQFCMNLHNPECQICAPFRTEFRMPFNIQFNSKQIEFGMR